MLLTGYKALAKIQCGSCDRLAIIVEMDYDYYCSGCYYNKVIRGLYLIQIIIEVQEGGQADATVDAIADVENIMPFDFARFEVKGIQT